MVHAALFLEEKCGLEILSLGRDGLAPKDSCMLELFGRHLFYAVILDGGWIFLDVALMDKGDPPERLFSVGDGPRGWRTVCGVVRLLEREEVRTLEKPIELGTGPSGLVIG